MSKNNLKGGRETHFAVSAFKQHADALREQAQAIYDLVEDTPHAPSGADLENLLFHTRDMAQYSLISLGEFEEERMKISMEVGRLKAAETQKKQGVRKERARKAGKVPASNVAGSFA